MTQTYVLPIPDGWAIVAYDDPTIPNDTIIPLPLTSSCSYDDALAFIATTELGKSSSFVDGWATPAELARCEPELAARI